MIRYEKDEKLMSSILWNWHKKWSWSWFCVLFLWKRNDSHQFIYLKVQHKYSPLRYTLIKFFQCVVNVLIISFPFFFIGFLESSEYCFWNWNLVLVWIFADYFDNILCTLTCDYLLKVNAIVWAQLNFIHFLHFKYRSQRL